MEKKNIVKVLLILVAAVGLLYLVVSQFNKIGTSDGNIDYYDMQDEILSKIDSLDSKWNDSSYSDICSILSDIYVAKGMSALESNYVEKDLLRVSTLFVDAANFYFRRDDWVSNDLVHIKKLSTHLENDRIKDIVDGYYNALSVINDSRLCSTQQSVENVISNASTYNKYPWTNSSDIKTGLESVRRNALDSYTSRSLIPLCNKLNDYTTNYTYFDDFDSDYQKVKSGKEFLAAKSYSNDSFEHKYNMINYNQAANDLDPRF